MKVWTQACRVQKPRLSLCHSLPPPPPGSSLPRTPLKPSPTRPLLSDRGLTVGHVAWGTGRILEDDGHQGLADGCLPAPGSLGPLSTGPPWGPARRLAHEVGGIGSDDLKAVWVGAWWHQAEVLGGLHGEDL